MFLVVIAIRYVELRIDPFGGSSCLSLHSDVFLGIEDESRTEYQINQVLRSRCEIT